MKTTTVLVTGVGGIIGQGIIKSLRMGPQSVRIIGLDKNKGAFGARYCDQFYTKPQDDQGEEYLNFLVELFARENIAILLPGIEQDVSFFDTQRDYFARGSTVIALNRHELIAIGSDKWLTHERLSAAGITTIPSRIDGTWQDCLRDFGQPPFLLKPRVGSGSRGQALLADETDFEYWRQKSAGNFMIQKLVGTPDEEYTVGTFGYGDGNGTAPVIFRRRLGPGGATWFAEVVRDGLSIEKMVTNLNLALKPFGPTNYQFRKEGDQVYLLEVNPRFSASTSLRAAVGYNESWITIDFLLHGRLPGDIVLRNARCVRYVEELVEYL